LTKRLKQSKMMGMWEIKSSGRIIDNITRVINELNAGGFKMPGPLKPWWSLVNFENAEELERMDWIRKNIPLHFKTCGTVYFVGYEHEPEVKIIKWFIPESHTLIKMSFPEEKPLIPIIHLKFTFDELVGKKAFM